MYKWFTVVLVLGVAGVVLAEDADTVSGATSKSSDSAPAAKKMRSLTITKEQFVKRQKIMAERKGEAFDPAAAEAEFDKLDTNKDGVLSGNELPQRAGMGGPVTMERFIEMQKKMAERKGETFDQAAVEARFAALDKNKDGVLTPDEFRASRQPRRGEAAGSAGTPEAASGDESAAATE